MIATDEDALVCDFAETYHVLDYRALPVKTAAALAFGLGDDSRIKRIISGASATTDTVFSAAIVDRLSLLVWAQTEDGRKGRNRPKSLLDALSGVSEEKDDVVTYESGDDFERARQKLLGKEA